MSDMSDMQDFFMSEQLAPAYRRQIHGYEQILILLLKNVHLRQYYKPLSFRSESYNHYTPWLFWARIVES
jgi:hypothetical protein